MNVEDFSVHPNQVGRRKGQHSIKRLQQNSAMRFAIEFGRNDAYDAKEVQSPEQQRKKRSLKLHRSHHHGFGSRVSAHPLMRPAG
ncbi:MAG TPA: hypothetical protein VJ727_10120 [Rhodanobacteraceae bacterium]|nr:hypothetical protein [Rhodanobacteraceae bacterium]